MRNILQNQASGTVSFLLYSHRTVHAKCVQSVESAVIMGIFNAGLYSQLHQRYYRTSPKVLTTGNNSTGSKLSKITLPC